MIDTLSPSLQEHALSPPFRFPWCGGSLHVAAIGLQVPRLTVVFQHQLHPATDVRTVSGVLNRDGRLDAALEIPWHQVGRGDQHFLLAAVAEEEGT